MFLVYSNQLNIGKGADEDDDQQRSPGCPVNSDAELTPDDDIWTLDEAYGAFPSANENENNSSFRELVEEQRCASGLMDLSLWRYEPEDELDQQPMITSDVTDLTSDPSTVTLESTIGSLVDSDYINSVYAGGRISPATGRVHDFGSDDEVTTAPRPFESGLVLKRAPNLRHNIPSTSGVSNEGKPMKYRRSKKVTSRSVDV